MQERLSRTYARAINLPRENVSTMTVAPVGEGAPVGGAAREQTRARYPDEDGYVQRDGVGVLLRGLRRG